MLCVGQTPLCHQAPGATNFTYVGNCGPYALILLQGAQQREKAALQTWLWLLGWLPAEAVQGQGHGSLCPGLSPLSHLLPGALLAWAGLAPGPWHRAMGRWLVLL